MLWAALIAKLPPLMKIGLVVAGVLGLGPPLLSLFSRFVKAREQTADNRVRRWRPLPPLAPPQASRPFDVRNRANERPQDRRTALRRKGNPVDVFVAEVEGEEFEGVVIDRSTGGLCLSLPRAVASEKLLKVIAIHAPEGSPWLNVKVRHCRQAADRWLCGCQFVEAPPWSQLLLFG